MRPEPVGDVVAGSGDRHARLRATRQNGTLYTEDLSLQPPHPRLEDASLSDLRFTVQDGQRGDDDGEANGEITDPGGPVASIAPAGVAIPALAPWGVWLLAGLLGVLGLRRRGG